ncbi:hypothetical protein L195_g026013 [Trifolium pratense]|uniref:Uncharacterized protein n=1 Tax=Trifolium pratense TaxID=57577 RepID=A0A2K3NI22_TRIPR|nr:hypothetical protein L195_g026013 [Trifolium pratense]
MMKSIKRESGVLKLVHAGRHIEIHTEPIIASEVMKRNPRHSVTRPDVFEFPWIVVKPESILVPGSVFLIVPNHTIYNLLKAKGQCNYHSPSFDQDVAISNWFGVDHVKHNVTHVSAHWTQPSCSMSRDSISIEDDYENPNMSNLLTRFSRLNPQYSPNNRVDCSKFKYDDSEENDEICTKVDGYEDTQKRSMEHESLDEPSLEFTPYRAVQYYQNHYKGGIDLEMAKKDVNLEFVASEQVNNLKSCLRRPNSIRRLLNLKVSFDINIREREVNKRIHTRDRDMVYKRNPCHIK